MFSNLWLESLTNAIKVWIIMPFHKIVPNARKIPDWISFLCGKSTKRMIKAFLCSGLTLHLHIFIFVVAKCELLCSLEKHSNQQIYQLNLLKAFVATLSCCDTAFLFCCLVSCVYSDDSLYYENIILILWVLLLRTIIKIYWRNIWLPKFENFTTAVLWYA